jgi:hypothetical protein
LDKVQRTLDDIQGTLDNIQVLHVQDVHGVARHLEPLEHQVVVPAAGNVQGELDNVNWTTFLEH